MLIFIYVCFAAGLPSHAQHELAKKLTTGFGGMVSFQIKGTSKTAMNFISNLKVNSSTIKENLMISGGRYFSVMTIP